MAAVLTLRGGALVGRIPALGDVLPGTLLAADSEEDHVAVLHAVVASLHAQLAPRTQRLHRACGDELVDRRHLGADEMLFEVGVNLARGDGRRRVLLARPCAHFRLARGEVGDQPARLPLSTRNAPEAGLIYSVAGAHFGLLGGV